MVLMVTVVFVVWYILSANKFSKELITASDGIKTSESDSYTEKKPTTNINVDTSKNTTEVPVSTEVKLIIDQLSEDNGSVLYRATVTNPGESGTCSAEFTNPNSKPVTKVTDATGGICGPVSLSVNEFDSLGSWTLTLRYYTGDTQAVATKTLQIN